jgi:hypothetical protein
MRNLHTGGVVLDKVERRHTFILGNSTVLERDSVVQLDTGAVGLHFVRRDGDTGFLPLRWLSFEEVVRNKRQFERSYITGEIAA